MSVLMADLDNLKKINDAHGHLLGEYVVGEIGRIIGEQHEEEGRYATRFGGDQYQTILPGFSKEEAWRSPRDGVRANPTLSLGVATYPEDDETRAADEALYRAKRLGGNTVSE